MKKNIKLFKYSLQKLEPLIDNFYIKEKEPIISNFPERPNQLMKDNQKIMENITAYQLAKTRKNQEMQKNTLKTVHSLLKNKELNYSEFTSFWAVIDVSYSVYKLLTNEEQLKFLQSVIEKYIEMRHNIYISHGYSATSLQVGKDAKMHKSSGNLGNFKIAKILQENKYTLLMEKSIDLFSKSDKGFLFIDRGGKKFFKEILEKFDIDFLWSKKNQNKLPDVLLKNKNKIYIIEHKHMKEGGGGQNKQIVEVVDFVGYSEPNALLSVCYVVFMDGIYFNLFAKNYKKESKLSSQIENIKINLKKNPTNYFVNTEGFKKLIKEI